jgi:hypothetical protein
MGKETGLGEGEKTGREASTGSKSGAVEVRKNEEPKLGG